MMKTPSYPHVVGIAVSIALVSGTSWAQVPQNLPGGADVLPGLILDRNQMPDATHTQETATPEKPPEPEIEDKKSVPDADDQSLNKPFKVTDIQVKGVQHISQDKIEAVIRPYEGKELSFIQLREVAEKLTQVYKDEGYMTTLVYIPPQRIENGVVTLQASEGIVGEVTYEEAKYWPERSVVPRMSVDEGDTFNVHDLRRDLRRINQNPDIKVRATLLAGDKTDETDIKLQADAKRPFHVTLFWDNLGRPVIGRQRGGVTTTHNNLTGFGDRIYNTVAWSRRSFSTVSHYELPVGSRGTTLNFDHAYSTLKIGGEFESLGLRGRAQIFAPYITQELINTDTMRVTADLGFDFKNVNTTSNGSVPNTDDRIRALRPAITIDRFDPWGRTIMRNELGIGLDIFDGTVGTHGTPSRIGAGTKFFRYTGALTRLHKMPLNSFAIFRVMGQATPDRLVSFEQFQLGGAYTVRGYMEGELIGDAGYMFSAEWRVPFYLLPKSWKIPKTNYILRDNIQLVSFADFGGVFVNRPTPGISKHEHALGLGAGVRFNLTRFLAGRLDLGIPVITAVPGNQYPRLHFGLESRLF